MLRLFAHIQIKVICLLLAFGLWFFVAHLREGSSRSPAGQNMSTLRIADVPVQLQGMYATQLAADPPTVQITVQWRREDIFQYPLFKEIYAVIPAEAADTRRIYSLNMHNFVLPPGWLLVEVEPEKIILNPLVQNSD